MEGTQGSSTCTPDSVKSMEGTPGGSTCTPENANAPEKCAMGRKNTDYFKDNIYWAQKQIRRKNSVIFLKLEIIHKFIYQLTKIGESCSVPIYMYHDSHENGQFVTTKSTIHG